MGILKDIREAWKKRRCMRERAPTFTRFTHTLPEFPLPQSTPLGPDLPHVAILTPCKNASGMLDRYFALLDGLDYPKDHIHLHLLEGDSSDDTYARAQDALQQRQDVYGSVDLQKLDLGHEFGARADRARLSIQRQRRAGIATCRNHLLTSYLDTPAEFALFIDVDLMDIPADALRRCLSFSAPVMMANCLVPDGSRSFDLNAFLYTRPVSDLCAEYYVSDDIYQPPMGFFRHYPAPDSSHEIEPLHSVGGTFLLVRRDVVEAGVIFPEEPYQLHIETEGFALMASDLGFGSFMLPQLHVRHGH